MGIYEYLALSKEEQWDVLWDQGVFLTSYKSIDCSFQLYAIERFYVELELCPLNGTILEMGLFVHGKKINKYLDDIYLDALGFL